MEEITVIQTPELTIKAHILVQVTNWMEQTMRFEAKVSTTTALGTNVEVKVLEVSNQNQFPVWIDENTPKMENGEQVMIGEWDMWQVLKYHTLMSDAESEVQRSLQRAFGLLPESFKYIEPQS